MLKPSAEPPASSVELRARAEAVLQTRPALTLEELLAATPEAARQLLRELQLRQIELELENEGLRAAASGEAARSNTQGEILNAIPAHVALLDPKGVILTVNESWRRFAAANLLAGSQACVGENYLTVCERASGECAAEAGEAANGIRRVLRGETREFALEYPCHSPHEQRWFRLTTTPLHEGGHTGAVVMHVNITERKLAEAARMVSEARSRAIIDATPVPMAINDETQRITYLNPAFTKTFGYELADIPTLAEWWPKAYPDPDYRRWVTEAWQAALAQSVHTGAAFAPVELRVCCKDGTDRVVVVGAAALEPAFAGAHLVVLHDITEQKQAEAALRASKAHLQATLDAIPDLLFEVGLDGRLYSYHTHRADLLAAPPEAFLGKTISDVLPAAAAAVCMRALAEALSKGWSAGATYSLPLPHGQSWFELSVAAMPDTGESERHFIVLSRDITNRKLAEVELAHMSELLEHTGRLAKVGGWELDLVAKAISGTREAARIHEVDFPIHADVFEQGNAFYGPDDWPMVQALVQEAIQHGTPYDFESPFTTAKGRRIWVRARGFAEMQNGKAVKLRGTLQDITERKLAEQAQEALLREKVALLKEVHHRVKNNLQVISSLLRLEAGRSAVDETKSVLAMMQSRIHTMAQLHESLYKSGTFASINLGDYLGMLSRQIFSAHLIRHDRVRLTLSLGSVVVCMDQANSCGLLLNELVSNCLKHAFPEDRSGEVNVALFAVPAQPESPAMAWCLRVSDTGVGLPVNFEEKRTASLGLQMVEDLSQQAGGSLSVESEPGEGTAFSFVFNVLAQPALGTRYD